MGEGDVTPWVRQNSHGELICIKTEHKIHWKHNTSVGTLKQNPAILHCVFSIFCMSAKPKSSHNIK